MAESSGAFYVGPENEWEDDGWWDAMLARLLAPRRPVETVPVAERYL